jgi:cell division protein FtsA
MFIHGVLHLKGYEHSATMDSAEERLLKRIPCMQKIVTGIDVGSYQVRVVIAAAPENPREAPRILGTGYAESRGLKHGYIVSIDEVSRSIAAATAQASKAAQVKVKRAYLGIGGIGLEEVFSRGETVVERGDSEITSRDLPRALAASENALSSRIDPQSPHHPYDSDALLRRRQPRPWQKPLGMKGVRLSVETLFITCLERHVHDLVEAVERAGIEVEDVAASPLAASFVALNKCKNALAASWQISVLKLFR